VREEAGGGKQGANEEINRKRGRHLAPENAACTLILSGWEDGCGWVGWQGG
jgi:hypothetical protein